ncbi:hypothetical protein ILUMI_12178 [Ignelater luminosus]|uniref:SMB domain-containing protein n=1 Tax=Ignelater luminosus TaxID=2038154 RepID=A0A8K0D3F1_IGNLU|nr:hypothetical protein ILUMI_12178 [Ignelater luminosus]
MTRLRWVFIAITTISFIGIVSAVSDYIGLPPGPYCGAIHRGCCPGRQDDCSAPIIGTLCYCDDFCNRTRNEDCCPDFLSFCKGIVEIPPEPIKTCYHNGQYYGYGKTAKENCNICKCEPMGNDLKMLCETNACLMEENIISTVNDMSEHYGWTASNYSEFWGRHLDEGIKLRLGTLQPHRFVRTMNPVRRIYDPNALPRFFDAEEKWPGYVTPIQNQGWCGSSWALSTAATASDRFAVVSQGLERVQLSAQNLLSCNNRGQQSCNGGYLDKAWLFLRKFGVVDENCYPYTGHDEKCRIPKKGNLLTSRCAPPYDVDRKEKYKVGPAYRLGNETDIMYEIIQSGPVQATIKVYHDFFSYRGGVYRHTDLSAQDRTGYHSVRIIGWGQEQDYRGRVQKYWKVANSWGREWGENGYFRIVRGTNECEIESFVLATWPLTVDPVSKNDVYGI